MFTEEERKFIANEMPEILKKEDLDPFDNEVGDMLFSASALAPSRDLEYLLDKLQDSSKSVHVAAQFCIDVMGGHRG